LSVPAGLEDTVKVLKTGSEVFSGAPTIIPITFLPNKKPFLITYTICEFSSRKGVPFLGSGKALSFFPERFLSNHQQRP